MDTKRAFVFRHVTPFAPAPSGQWGPLWAATQCERLPRAVALVHFDTAAHHGPGLAFVLLRRALGLDERPEGLRADEMTMARASNPTRTAIRYVEHRRQHSRTPLTGNEHGHLDRLIYLLQDIHAHEEATRAARRGRQSGVYTPPPVTFYRERPADPATGSFLGHSVLVSVLLGLGVIMLTIVFGG